MKRQNHPSANEIFTGLATLFFTTIACIAGAQSYVLTKSRAPQLHVKDYKQIAIGDIVGPIGIENERSLDLRDAVTSKLFNSNNYEVVDRNTLSQILTSQKKTSIKIIDENTITSLSKQLKSALLITGRMQTEKVEQKLYTSKDYTCPNNVAYQWIVSGEVAVQLKLIDITSGKMIFSAPVANPVSVQSTKTCDEKNKFDVVPIVNKAFEGLTDQVTKLIIPYSEQINIVFDGPALVIFKNPFKKLNEVVSLFNIGDYAKGVEILKKYAEDNSLKDNLKPKAHFNYAMGLFCMSRYDDAKAELKNAISLDPAAPGYEAWYTQMDKEKEEDKNLMANIK